MADPSDPEADAPTTAGADAAEPTDERSSEPTDERPATDERSATGGPRRSLDRRTIAICAVLGVIAALLTVLVASALTSDDAGADDSAMVLEEPIDEGVLFSTELDTVDGGTTTLAAFQADQPMLVNLWQSFCSPCVREMPLLEAAQADNPDITFVGVATQDTVDKAKGLAEQTGITYPWALDPSGEFFYEAQGQGMPTTLLLSAAGKVIDTKTGEFKDADQLQAFLDQAG